MRQLQQDLRNGTTSVIETPVPKPAIGQVLVRSRASLVSAGTERILVDFGRAGLLRKAAMQPEKVRQALDKVRTDGLVATLAAIRNKLEQPLSPGYCSAGVVVEAGAGVSGLRAGERVVSNGKHADFVCVPSNLCARIPETVSDENAAFTVLGAIALQGIRLAQPTLGERFAVFGLGLVGLLAVQLLRAHGCRVLAIDLDSNRVQLARRFDAEGLDLSTGADPVAGASSLTEGRGVDGVIIAASTSSNDPVRQAARMSRKRGRIVLVGVTGLELSRSDFYEKELTFQVSCSYGPGRYDSEYEEKGRDYPFGFVRWTEQRNFEAVLDLMAQGKLDVAPLITHRFPLSEAPRAYELIASAEPHLGVLLEYGTDIAQAPAHRTVQLRERRADASAGAVIGVIGAGNYASSVLLPALARTTARRKLLASITGTSGAHQAKKHGFEALTSDPQAILDDPEINAVVIATRHDSHAGLVLRAIEHGKHVFVEKPLAVRSEELELVRQAYDAAKPAQVLTVGLNRRFAPQAAKMKDLLRGSSEQKSVIITVNAGAIPANHWTQDSEVGGGRIIGEACHFIDLARFLVGATITDVQAVALGKGGGLAYADKASVTLKFADGSFAVVHYLANGHRSFPKERVEVFCGGRILQLDNFRRLRGYGWPRFSGSRLWRQDKGNAACIGAFVRAVETGAEPPIPVEELFEVSEATLRAADLLRC
jgi:predicted dehydrogenase/threonine dehydrogenase-like Zn-dependent dehydrogenase